MRNRGQGPASLCVGWHHGTHACIARSHGSPRRVQAAARGERLDLRFLLGRLTAWHQRAPRNHSRPAQGSQADVAHWSSTPPRPGACAGAPRPCPNCGGRRTRPTHAGHPNRLRQTARSPHPQYNTQAASRPGTAAGGQPRRRPIQHPRTPPPCPSHALQWAFGSGAQNSLPCMLISPGSL